ncbi:MAG: xanthine dehydrogenase family protein molybdopterin-binding subunit [Betaproteobacteria bacterium PRO3]|nr:xanthine dehydrogenase family protein molybdopterin-binding subunit [Betaproteobacteria bacterium PRO3]
MAGVPLGEREVAVTPSRDGIGAPLRRVEDDALLRGAGRFVSDLAPTGCLHAAFVRSPWARARLRSVDTSAAERMPGVRLVLTGAKLAQLPPLPVNPVIDGIRPFAVPILAVDRVNHVGAPVALVVADDATLARDAAEAVALDFEPLDPVIDVAHARDGDALLAGWPDNLAFERRWASGDFAAATSSGACTVEVTIACPRVAPLALEPRAFVADGTGGRLTVWLQCQSPHRARDHLSAILRIPKESVRTIAPDVGGAFGGRASLYPEDVAVAHAALALARPVRWVALRNEDMIAASHGRGGVLRASATFDADGRLRALSAELDFALGSWATFSAAVPAMNAGRILPGPYRVDAVDIVARGYVTNTAPVGIYRGAGRPEAALVMERLMDAAGRELALDPAEIRRRNLVSRDAMPYRTPTGQAIDSGRYADLLASALERADYHGLREEQRRRRASGEIVGVGLNVYVEPCGSGFESARVTLLPDGRFLVASGSSAQGQGHRTSYAQVASSVLDVPVDRIVVVEGDSDTSPAGIGAVASRSMAIGGSAVKLAAERLKAKLAERASAAGEAAIGEAIYTAPAEAWSAGCCIAAMAIDRDTGVPTLERVVWVDDAGVVVNPLLAEGQLAGGFAQGLGTALMERIHYDADGQITTGTLLDYALPRARDVPPLVLESLSSATAANALGAKGIGESGCIAAPAAILGAALDALAPHGVTDLSFPLTSEALWRALHPDCEEPA